MNKVTKQFQFEAAHLLSGYEGGCRNLHGHSYKLEVTVGSETLGKDDMIVDFAVLKDITKTAVLDKFDHSMIISTEYGEPLSEEESDLEALLEMHKMKVAKIQGYSTAENMCATFFKLISREVKNRELSDTCKVLSVKLWETSTSVAEYTEGGE